jgi:hypothetical protein
VVENEPPLAVMAIWPNPTMSTRTLDGSQPAVS